MKKYLIIFAVISFVSAGMACEPGGTLMEDNLQKGFGMAVAFIVGCAALVLVDFGQLKYKFLSLLYFALVPLHPYWWMSVYSGDCGITMKNSSTVSIITLGCYLLFRLHRRFVGSKPLV